MLGLEAGPKGILTSSGSSGLNTQSSSSARARNIWARSTSKLEARKYWACSSSISGSAAWDNCDGAIEWRGSIGRHKEEKKELPPNVTNMRSNLVQTFYFVFVVFSERRETEKKKLKHFSALYFFFFCPPPILFFVGINTILKIRRPKYETRIKKRWRNWEEAETLIWMILKLKTIVQK